MKIKTDFVTNSSSINFIFSCPVRITEGELGISPAHAVEKFECLDTIENLISYAQDDPCDWITKITGPRRFWQLGERWYGICKDIINGGNYAIRVKMNNNYWDETERMKNYIEGHGGVTVVHEHD